MKSTVNLQGPAQLRTPFAGAQTKLAAHLHADAPWTDIGFYVILVVLVCAIVALAMKVVKGPARPQTYKEVADAKGELERQLNELKEAEKEIKGAKKKAAEEARQADPEAAPAVAEDEEEDEPPLDYEAALRAFAQVVAQTVGPKVAKAQAVKNIVETRVQTLTNSTKSFVMDEMHGTAGAVLGGIGAEEAMLLLDPAKALEGNFPPAPVLLAGLFSPIVLGATALNHVLQAYLHFLPVLCMCIACYYVDSGPHYTQICDIPTIFWWRGTHCVFAGILFLAHNCQVIKVVMGQKYLAKQMEEQSVELKTLSKNKNPDIQQIRDMFIKSCVIVQKALQQEDNVRRSFFGQVIGLLTAIWLLLTIWTFVVVLGWTLVPGTIAFHHSAVEAAEGDFCGAWFTVFTARMCAIIGVLFLLVNFMTVSQWLSDSLKFSPVYANQVLKQAKKIDDNAGGIPVVQTLVKAFVLRGSSETLELQMSTATMEKTAIAGELAAAEAELASVRKHLVTVSAQHDTIAEEVGKMPQRSFIGQKAKPRALPPQAASSSGPSIADQANVQLDAAKVQGQQALDTAKAQGEQMAAQGKEALDAAKAQGQEAFAQGMSQLQEIDIEAKKAEAIALAQQTKEELVKMLEQIMAKLQELRESETVQQAMAEMQSRAEAAAKIAQEKAAEAKAAADELINSEEMQQALAGDTAALQEKVRKKTEEAVEAGKKAVEEIDVEELKRKAGEAVEAGKQKASEAVEAGKKAIDEVDVEELKKKASEHVETAKQKAGEAVEAGKKAVDEVDVEELKEKAKKVVKK